MNKKCCSDKTYTSITSSQKVLSISASQTINQGLKTTLRSFFSFHQPFLSIFNRLAESDLCSDLLPIIFYMMNLKTLLTCRRVSPQWLQFVHTNISDQYQFTPFFNKARIFFKGEEICDTKIDDKVSIKYEFAKNNTRIKISYTLADLLKKGSNLLTRFKSLSKNHPVLSFHINTSAELTELNALLSSSTLSKEQKSILNNTTCLALLSDKITIDHGNIASVNQFLTNIAQPNELFSQLISLELEDILAPLTLSSLSNLSSLKLGSVGAPVTLKNLPQLISLKLQNIIVPLTLPSLPNLSSLKFWGIAAAITFPETFPNLVSLSFGNIQTLLELPPLYNLSSLSFNSILKDGVVQTSTLPNLSSLSFMDIFSPQFTLPSFPNLSSLSFKDISFSRVTLPSFPNLSSLSFGKINYGHVMLPSLPNLSSLEFGEITGDVTLTSLRQLILFSFRNYSLFQNFKIILNFIIHYLNILLGTKINPI